MEKRVLVHVESSTELLAISEDLGRKRVAICRHEAGFFKHRQIHVRLNVTHRTGVTVPVPGAAEVAALFNDAEIVDTELAKVCCFEHAAETTTDDYDIDIGNLGIAGETRFNVRITIEFFIHASKC